MARRFFPRMKGYTLQGSSPPSYVGLLDLVPGALQAVSDRALSAAWLGQNVCKLRRDSDQAEHDFACDAVTGAFPTAEAIAWRDAEGAATAYYVTRYDQSGNGHDITQSDPEFQPVWGSSVIGGKSGPVYSASTFPVLKTASPITIPSAFSVFCVAKKTASAGGALCGANYLQGDGMFTCTMSELGGSQFFYMDSTDDNFATNEWGGASTAVANASRLNIDAIFFFKCQAGTLAFEFNGVAQTVDENFNTGTVDAINEVLCEGADEPDGGNGCFDGPMPERIHYGSLLSAPNTLLVAQNQATYYNITLP